MKAKVQSGKLRIAILYKATFDQADFRNATLYRAVLIGARGVGTTLTKADLSEIYAPNAQLHHAQFNEAILESAISSRRS